MSEVPSVEDVQKLISRGPFHQWLGLKVIAVGSGTIELTATSREEWVVNPDRGYIHGGILATLVDLTADWAMVSKTGRGVPTIDLRVDYHRAAMPGVLTVRGEIVNFGRQFSVAEAKVLDHEGRLLASGRGDLSDSAAGLIEISVVPQASAFTNLGSLTAMDRDLDKIAIIDLGTGEERRFSYRDFETQANAVARALTAWGLVRGDRVAILSANRFEYLTTVHGIMRAGFVAVPVNFKFPPATIDYIIHDSGAKLVFCDAQRFDDAPKDLPRIQFDGDSNDFASFIQPGPFTALVAEPGESAMFLYTSGSTGRPKGVVLSHQSHIWVVEQRMAAQDMSRHRFLVAAPLYHMNALAMSQLAHAADATVILLPQFTTGLYLHAIETYHCTWLTAVPPMIAMMLNDRERLAATDLSSVKFLRMGSAPVSHSLLEAIHRTLPSAAVTNAYGTTEAGPVVFGPHPKGLPPPEMSVGYPHPKVQLRLIGEDGHSADTGVLEMKCPAIMTGYHNRPDIKPPITPDGFYITGDVFRRDENGFYFFVGRTDDMFVSGGENIFPGEVEKMLETHPDVIQACVVPVPDDIKGTKPVAFVVVRQGSDLTESALKEYALKNAPAYQHPRSIWFVDSLPLASTNKADRNRLRELAAEKLMSGKASSAQSLNGRTTARR